MYKLIINFAIYRVINLFFPIVTIPLISYYTNYSVMAELFLLQAYAFWVSLVIDFGFIRTGVVDYLNSQKKQTIVNEIITSQLYLSLLIIFISLIISFLFEIKSSHLIFVLATGIIQGIIPKWLYQAENRMLSLSIKESFSKILALALLLIFLPIYNSIDMIIISYISMSLLIVFLIVLDYKHYLLNFKLSSINLAFKTINNSLYVFKMRLVGNGYLNLNIIILSILSSQEVIATYGICERLVKAMTSVLTSVGEALFPISVKENSSPKLLRDLKISFMTSLFPTLVMLIFPNQIISILLSSDINLTYERIIFLAPIFFSLSSVLSLCYITSKGMYKADFYIQLIILLLSLISIIFLYFIIGENYPYLAFLCSSFFSFLTYSIYVISKEKSNATN
ncbi:oligosaccharide flippase family protein [Providencia rettgeri]|nr:oligosaccharide flippase family protein [Providencia rettgeri]